MVIDFLFATMKFQLLSNTDWHFGGIEVDQSVFSFKINLFLFY